MSKTALETLENYPIHIQLPVAWGDMDAMQHVNNVAYFRYMETARVSFFEQVGLMDYANEHQVGLIVAKQQCKYVRAVTYPDLLTIGMKLTNIKDDGFELKYLMESNQLDSIAAIGSSTMISWSIRDQQKMTLPDSIKRDIESKARGGR